MSFLWKTEYTPEEEAEFRKYCQEEDQINRQFAEMERQYYAEQEARERASNPNGWKKPDKVTTPHLWY